VFNFQITPLGNLFFGLTLAVFISLFVIREKSEKNELLETLLLLSLGVIFYADDLITLFIGWEVMSWSSYFIIAKSAKEATRERYIIFNLTAGFALLGAIVLILSYSGTALYSEIDFKSIPTSLHLPITLLVLTTIAIKSGVMPLHHWIVDTYEESNHLFSAVLSAIISKAGIFLFILIFTKIMGYQHLQSSLFTVVAWLGVVTSIVATFKAINQDNMKRLLAYSSVAQLGYIITIFAILKGSGIEAGLYHTVIHTFVKLLLFINIASIIYITGKDKFSELGGLIDHYPLLFILLLIGIIGLAGVPLLGGFNGKFLIYSTLIEEKKSLLLTAIMFSSASAFLYCYKLVYGIYLGQPTHDVTTHKRLPKSYYTPQILGAVVLFILGIMPSLLTVLFTNPIATSLELKSRIVHSLFVMESGLSSFNGLAIMLIFIIIFTALFLLLYRLKNESKRVQDRLDISYCGEVPNPKSNLHFGYGVGEELRRISFVKAILNNSTQPYWQHISTLVKDSSLLVKSLYSSSIQNIGLLSLLFFIILLFIGVK